MVSIIIPVFNQEQVLTATLLKVNDVMGGMGQAYEIIFIDDGSSDRSFELLKDIYVKCAYIKVVRLSKNFGQHIALLAGFELAQGEIVITMDADAKVSPSYIPELLRKMKEKNDLVVCWRKYRPGISMIRRMGSLLINKYINFKTGKELHDHACSLKAYSRNLIDANIGRVEIKHFFGILVVKYANYVDEIQVACNYKKDSDSSLNFRGLVVLFLNFILRINKMQHKEPVYFVKDILCPL